MVAANVPNCRDCISDKNQSRGINRTTVLIAIDTLRRAGDMDRVPDLLEKHGQFVPKVMHRRLVRQSLAAPEKTKKPPSVAVSDLTSQPDYWHNPKAFECRHRSESATGADQSSNCPYRGKLFSTYDCTLHNTCAIGRVNTKSTANCRLCEDRSPYRLVMVGYPGDVGGASTEAYHSIRLWRRAGIEVTLIPTWRPNQRYQPEMDSLLAKTVTISPRDVERHLRSIPRLAGSPVVSFCNSHFYESGAATVLRDMGCPIIWLNCMTWPFGHEQRWYTACGPPDAMVCQSQFQMRRLQKTLGALVPRDRYRLIRGGFDVSLYEYRPRPHLSGEEFVMGKLSRAARDKWHKEMFRYVGKVPNPKRLLMMGVDHQTLSQVGTPPRWAKTYKPNEIPATDFMRQCHAVLGLNGSAKENWPRVGLEAMAHGVPVVAPNDYGWTEMLEHGTTGMLYTDMQDMVSCLSKLQRSERLRMTIAEAARNRVNQLADPVIFGDEWKNLLDSVTKE